MCDGCECGPLDSFRCVCAVVRPALRGTEDISVDQQEARMEEVQVAFGGDDASELQSPPKPSPGGDESMVQERADSSATAVSTDNILIRLRAQILTTEEIRRLDVTLGQTVPGYEDISDTEK